MKLSIELEVNENVDPHAVHQLLHWAKQVERSAAGLETVEATPLVDSADVTPPGITPPGIPAPAEPRRRGRPRKDAAEAHTAPAPAPVSSSVAAVPPQQPYAAPSFAYQPSPVFSGMSTPTPVAMPPTTPVPPSPTGEMSLEEFRAAISAGQAQNPGAWFNIAKQYGYFTLEVVPADKRRPVVDELRAMLTQIGA